MINLIPDHLTHYIYKYYVLEALFWIFLQDKSVIQSKGSPDDGDLYLNIIILIILINLLHKNIHISTVYESILSQRSIYDNYAIAPYTTFLFINIIGKIIEI